MAEGRTITIIQKGKVEVRPTIYITPSMTYTDVSDCGGVSADGIGNDQPIQVIPSDKTLKWQIYTNFYLALTKEPYCICSEPGCYNDCSILISPGNEGAGFPDESITSSIFVGDQTFYPLSYGAIGEMGDGKIHVRYIDYKDITADATVRVVGG